MEEDILGTDRWCFRTLKSNIEDVYKRDPARLGVVACAHLSGMSVVSGGAEENIPTLPNDTSHTKRHHARLHLISGLKDRGLKAPLKWSPWLSEVSIPDYREECRQLGDPMLFTRYQRLATPLCKKEEGELFSDTNSPLATYSYHLKNDSRHIQSRRGQRIGAEVGREVSISELHQLMNKDHYSQTAGQKRLHSSSLPQFTPPPGLSIAIQNNSSYNSIFDKLPKITLTIKQISDSKSYSSDKTRARLSQSYDSFPAPTQVKLQRGPTSFEKNVKAKHSQESGVQQRDRDKTEADRKKAMLNLQQLNRMSRSELTKDWIQHSPLGAQRQEEDVIEAQEVKPRQRKVRFGARDS